METAEIIGLVVGLVLSFATIVAGAVYFAIRYVKIEKPNLDTSKKELEEMKQQTEEMKYSNKLSLYELGIIKDKPIPPKHIQTR